MEAPKYSQDKITELEGTRIVSDAELIKNGAQINLDENNERTNLIITEDIKEVILKKHARDVWEVRKDEVYPATPEEKIEVEKAEVEAVSLFVEKLRSLANLETFEGRSKFVLLMSFFLDKWREPLEINYRKIEEEEKKLGEPLRTSVERLKQILEESRMDIFPSDGPVCMHCLLNSVEKANKDLAFDLSKTIIEKRLGTRW